MKEQSKNNQWCSLHSHSFYSLLDGCSSVQQCIKRAKEVGIPRFAVTDHGMMSGALDLLHESKKQGILGLIGVEFYVSEQYSTVKDTENRHLSHLVMVAKDIVGYRQLCKMLSKANSNESFYYKPRLSLNEIDEFLATDRGHVLGVCGHMGSTLGEQIIVELSKGQWEYQQNWKERGKKCIQKLQQMFGEHNFGVEIQTYEGDRSGFKELIIGLRELCKEVGAVPITTADSHYSHRELAEIQRVLLCVQMKKKLNDMMANPNELGIFFTSDHLYIPSREELEQWGSTQEELDNTIKITDSCEEIDLRRDPVIPVPPMPDKVNHKEYLLERCRLGYQKRYKEVSKDKKAKIGDRVKQEIAVLEECGLIDYFLMMDDLVTWCKKQGYLVNGRGCVIGDTMVSTPTGSTPIRDLKRGDTVIDRDGNMVEVSNTHRYQCNERLISVGLGRKDSAVTMTSDHKVLVCSSNRGQLLKHHWSTDRENVPSPDDLHFIRADKIRVDDWVVTPMPNFANRIDDFVIENNAYVRRTSRANTNKHSARRVAQGSGVPPHIVRNYVKGRNIRNKQVEQKLQRYMVDNEITVDSIQDNKVVTTLCRSRVDATYDAGYVFGYFIAHGWFCHSKPAGIGFAACRSTDVGVLPEKVRTVFGVDMSIYEGKTDCRQYYIHHRGIRELFDKLFCNCACAAHSKYIPQDLLETNADFRSGLLEGLWAGDGSDSGLHSRYTTVSRRLASQVRLLLLSRGLPATIATDTQTHKKRAGFYKHDTTATSFRVSTTRRRVSPTDKHKLSHYYCDGQYIYYRVKKIDRREGDGVVYDITVPGTHSYLTDSYVVHNSSAGCAVSYLLGITNVCPIDNELIFERFYNKGRAETMSDGTIRYHLPDIDLDVPSYARDHIIDHLREQYGHDNVGQIVTFATMKGKNALKDVCRTLGTVDESGVNEICKCMPEEHVITNELSAMKERLGYASIVQYCLEEMADTFRVYAYLNERGEIEGQYSREFSIARSLEGIIRGTGVHAAGQIIWQAPTPLNEVVPFVKQKDNDHVLAFEGGVIESVGCVKFDLLGVFEADIIKTFEHYVRTGQYKVFI